MQLTGGLVAGADEPEDVVDGVPWSRRCGVRGRHRVVGGGGGLVQQRAKSLLALHGCDCEPRPRERPPGLGAGPDSANQTPPCPSPTASDTNYCQEGLALIRIYRYCCVTRLDKPHKRSINTVAIDPRCLLPAPAVWLPIALQLKLSGCSPH